ncbi:MAG: ArgR family transcriptional regulator [Acidobacteria bacterium RIFCSPLOWO2_12_FULL_54_10]|nr:MAG: ArgR family transcriptional regulator [Acidobacteria bacterium RIFCSPLOWO2_12_FULL_54_10]
MTKTYRHGQILNLIRSQSIRTQEELAQALHKSGIEVTQVTLSRDIHELGLVKGPQGYQVQERAAPPEEPAALGRAVAEFVRDVKTAQNVIIIKTASGHAQPVAVALDREAWPEIAGTIAGDDTVFAVAPDSRLALKAREKILALLR